MDRDVDPLAWWKEKESGHVVAQALSVLARYCFSIPGSSAMLERAFGPVGGGMGPKRAILTKKHAVHKLFVHENVARDAF